MNSVRALFNRRPLSPVQWPRLKASTYNKRSENSAHINQHTESAAVTITRSTNESEFRNRGCLLLSHAKVTTQSGMETYTSANTTRSYT